MASPIKDVIRKSRDKYLLVEGPTCCDLTNRIAQAAGGSQVILHKSTNTEFTVPQTDDSTLRNFFYHHRHQTSEPVTLTTIPNGRVYTGGVVISPSGHTIARDVSIDFGKAFDEHSLIGSRIQRPKHLKGKTLCVNSAGVSSYYHWLLDELPRYLVSDHNDINQVICSRNTNANRLALRLLGLGDIPTIAIDEPGRFQKRSYCSDVLLVPSYVTSTGTSNSLLIDLLCSLVEPLISKSSSLPEKIIISREHATGRRIIDKSGSLAHLEDTGYTRIYLEDLSWTEQVNLFFQAREIVSPHGAGLANLAFCSKKPLVVEIFHRRYVHWCFWMLADLVGASYRPVALPSGLPVEHNVNYARADIIVDENDKTIIDKTTKSDS